MTRLEQLQPLEMVTHSCAFCQGGTSYLCKFPRSLEETCNCKTDRIFVVCCPNSWGGGQLFFLVVFVGFICLFLIFVVVVWFGLVWFCWLACDPSLESSLCCDVKRVPPCCPEENAYDLIKELIQGHSEMIGRIEIGVRHCVQLIATCV